MMNDSSPISPSGFVALTDRGRGWRYLLVGIAANLTVLGTVILLSKDAPRVYTSQWSAVLLGKGAKAIANSPTSPAVVGVAGNPETDIKATYQVIATTQIVRKVAAAKVGMTTEQFGQPVADAVQGTNLINVTITGSSREEAQKKAYALYAAFQERLQQLRLEQAQTQEAGLEQTLSVARKKLETAQIRLSDYKLRAGMASSEQINQLVNNIETLRRLRAEIVAQQQDASMRAQQLATILKVSPPLAADAFTLRADPLFQRYLQDYSEATATLTNLTSKLGPNHPAILREATRQSAAEAALQSRGQQLLGRSLDAMAIARLPVSGSPQPSTSRDTLLQDIVSSQVERQGLTARVQELDRQLYQLEQRLVTLAQRSSTLDSLNRDMQIAEAMFTSRLAGVDTSQVDIFSSYPLVQLVAEPNLPETGVTVNQKPLFLSAAIVSLVVTSGLLALWFRRHPRVQNWLYQNNLAG